jgi:hypothetical protein
MRVKVLRDHNNTYGLGEGAPVTKTKGTEYNLPDAMAATLIGIGLVEEVKPAPAAKGDKAS